MNFEEELYDYKKDNNNYEREENFVSEISILFVLFFLGVIFFLGHILFFFFLLLSLFKTKKERGQLFGKYIKNDGKLYFIGDLFKKEYRGDVFIYLLMSLSFINAFLFVLFFLGLFIPSFLYIYYLIISIISFSFFYNILFPFFFGIRNKIFLKKK